MPSTTNQSMFEALFDRRLKPEGAFAAALKASGYDPASPRATYATETWVACLEVARAQRWPALSVAEAYRKIGREFTEGFLETLVGKMVSVALPFMTPLSFVRRLGNYMRMGRNDSGLTFDLTREEANAIDVVVHNPAGVPGTFVAGMIDAAYERFKVQWTIEVEQRSATDYTLAIRWSR